MDIFAVDSEMPAHRVAQSLTLISGRARICIMMCLTLELEIDVMPNAIVPPPAFTENSAASGVLSLELWKALWCFAFLAQVTFIGERLYLEFCSPDIY